MKRLSFALLTLFALGHMASAQNVNLTFDVTGTYPANAPTSRFTAPRAAFLLEFTVPASVPATPTGQPFYFTTPLIKASYSFEGVVHPAPATSSFTRSDSGGNLEIIELTYGSGTLELASEAPYHQPFLTTQSGSLGLFLLGDLGGGSTWYVYYARTNAPRVSSPVNVTDVVSRPASH